MLYLFFFKQSFLNFFQSSFYFDFFFKKITEVLTKNFLIYSSLFFGEKYFIEVLTKKVVDYFFLVFNKLDFNKGLFLNLFFLQVVVLCFYSFFFLQVYLFIY